MFTIDYRSQEVLLHSNEGFQYWEHRLACGSAYQMALKDNLIDVFDYPLPCISGISFTPDQDDFQQLLSILCKWMFSNLKNPHTRCCSLDGINFDVQTRILEISVFERGIDIIGCNCMSCSVLRCSMHGICNASHYLAFNHAIYKGIEFMDVVLNVAKMLSFQTHLAANAKDIYDAAHAHDISKLASAANARLQTSYAQLEHEDQHSIQLVDPKLECMKLMGDGFDDGVLEWHDRCSCIMCRDDASSDVLVVHLM